MSNLSEGTEFKRNQIFISHSSKDGEIADLLKHFFVNIGVSNDSIFCSSSVGNGVNYVIGMEVKEALQKSAVNIMLFSDNYFKSQYCMNEAGVIWYLEPEVKGIAIGLDGFVVDDAKGVINKEWILRRLDKKVDVLIIADLIKDNLGIFKNNSAVIEKAVNDLINSYDQYEKSTNKQRKQENAVTSKIPSDTEEELSKFAKILLLYTNQSVINAIEYSKTSLGTVIKVGLYLRIDSKDKRFWSWKRAVEELKEQGLIVESAYGEQFDLTEKGKAQASTVADIYQGEDIHFMDLSSIVKRFLAREYADPV